MNGQVPYQNLLIRMTNQTLWNHPYIQNRKPASTCVEQGSKFLTKSIPERVVYYEM